MQRTSVVNCIWIPFQIFWWTFFSSLLMVLQKRSDLTFSSQLDEIKLFCLNFVTICCKDVTFFFRRRVLCCKVFSFFFKVNTFTLLASSSCCISGMDWPCNVESKQNRFSGGSLSTLVAREELKPLQDWIYQFYYVEFHLLSVEEIAFYASLQHFSVK